MRAAIILEEEGECAACYMRLRCSYSGCVTILSFARGSHLEVVRTVRVLPSILVSIFRYWSLRLQVAAEAQTRDALSSIRK